MSVLSLYPVFTATTTTILHSRLDTRSNTRGRFVVSSTHSNPKILKSNKKSRFGQPLSLYDDDEAETEDDDDGDDEEKDDWLTAAADDDEDDFAETQEYDVNGKKHKSRKGSNTRQGMPYKHFPKLYVREDWINGHCVSAGNQRSSVKDQGIGSLKSRRSLGFDEDQFDVRKGRNTLDKSTVANPYRTSNISKEVGSLDVDVKEEPMTKNCIRYKRLSEEIDLDVKWLPLINYLSTFGLKESHFIQMYERHMPSLQINVCSAQERLEYLLSVGVKQRDVRRILMRQPQILEYTVENNLKSHVAFLMSLGIPNSRIGQIIGCAPSLFSYSVENSLKPTVRYLVEEVGINEKNIGKVVQLSPQILVQRIDISWNTRYIFLSKELGAPRDNVVKMVTKHPQLLHYSIDDGLLPRINFLRSIGMRNSEILKVLTSLTQVLSLSLEDNLKPKYMYLINELRNEVQSLTKYPMYLSLSLDQRIRPRHRFLVSLKKAPKGPFPLSSLVPTDESFCQQWAGTSVDKYLEFRQRLLLKDFANKYDKRG
ncbi:hypothetical protein Ddye_027680 [Dipteronia dyeriana]|uniref:Transcription termination factor MTERF9, chloroplastic n=1 Tax=Dipteronia dyeriana TaxID=168575 RepID=A0AAD9WRN7_9ROSI|nr:hypothetical protein Ddye_027680 [Dipteronia dyeriana]